MRIVDPSPLKGGFTPKQYLQNSLIRPSETKLIQWKIKKMFTAMAGELFHLEMLFPAVRFELRRVSQEWLRENRFWTDLLTLGLQLLIVGTICWRTESDDLCRGNSRQTNSWLDWTHYKHYTLVRPKWKLNICWKAFWRLSWSEDGRFEHKNPT